MIRPLLAIAFTLSAGAALAQSAPEPDVIKALKACSAIKADPERLACFDKAAQSVTKAQETGEVIIIDKQSARAARRQAFGLDLPSLSILDRGADKAETETLQATVKAARNDAESRLVVTLDDGAVWRQVDSEILGKPPKAGDAVEIRKASMGSYLMKIGKQPAIRVRRSEGGATR